MIIFQISPNVSESEDPKDQVIQENNGPDSVKIEPSRLTIPSSSKKQRHSASSISLLKSIPEATGNGASEVEVADQIDKSEISTSNPSNEQPSSKVPLKSVDSTPSSSMSLLNVTVSKGPSARSASLQPPQEIEDETEMLLFNRRQSGILVFKFEKNLCFLHVEC